MTLILPMNCLLMVTVIRFSPKDDSVACSSQVSTLKTTAVTKPIAVVRPVAVVDKGGQCPL